MHQFFNISQINEMTSRGGARVLVSNSVQCSSVTILSPALINQSCPSLSLSLSRLIFLARGVRLLGWSVDKIHDRHSNDHDLSK